MVEREQNYSVTMKSLSQYIIQFRQEMAVLVLATFFLPHSGASQISEQDKAMISKIKNELTLTGNQSSLLDSLFLNASLELKKYDDEIKELQTSDLDEEQISLKVAVLNQKKKDKRELRDIEFRMILTAEQKQVYEEKIKPAKPQVLHYGMNHDRMNCNVCNQ